MKAEKWAIYQLRWGLGQVLALIALGAIYSLDLPGDWLILALGLAVALVTAQPQWAGRFQPYLVRFVQPLVIVYIIIDFLLSGGQVLGSLIRTMAVLLAYRALEFRLPRQDRQLLLLSLMLLLLTGVLTADLLFAVLLFFFVPLAIYLLAVIVVDEEGGKTVRDWVEPWGNFAWRRWFGYMLRRLDRRLLLFASGLYLGFAALSMGAFWLLPRFDFGYGLPFMKLESRSSLSGFSETVRFGSVVEIKEDLTVAMRVDGVPAEGLAPYWRMMVLDEYLGSGFRQSESAAGMVREVQDYALFGPGRGEAAEAAVWTHYYEGGVSRHLPMPGGFSALRFQTRQNLVVNEAVAMLSLREPLAGLLVYRMDGVAESAVFAPGPAESRLLASGEALVEPGRYPGTTLGLPLDEEERAFLGGVVASLTGEAAGPRDTVAFGLAATEWLQTGRGYSLRSVVEGDGDPLVAWMRSGQPGHCELFAGSLVLLSRAAGIPSRLVTGFHGGVRNGFEEYFSVRHADAHAWVELYDPGVGWRRFDPTPGQLATPLDHDSIARFTPVPVDATFDAFLDSLRVLWYRRVVNFDHKDQEALLAEFGGVAASSWDRLGQWFSTLPERWRLWWAGGNTDLAGGPEGANEPVEEPMPGRWLVLAVAVGLGFLGWRFGRRRWPLGGDAERRVRTRADRWLQRLEQRPHLRARISPEDHASLLVLRFGPSSIWESPHAVFRQLKSRRRRRDRTDRV